MTKQEAKIDRLETCQARLVPNNLFIENLVFSSYIGFLFGAVAKKVMKIAVVIIGLFVVGLSYLSYKGWIGL